DAHADAAEDLDDPVHLLDAGHPAEGGASPVEERGAEQRDRRVLAGEDVDRTAELAATLDTQVGRAGLADLDEPGVEHLADAGQHLHRHVLAAALDPVDCALTGAERAGELLLAPSPMAPGVAHEASDPFERGRIHERSISSVRW